MPVEAAVGHQLVDEEQLTASMAPADKLHKVLVAKPAYDPHLRGILLPPLLRALGDSFDGHVKVQFLEEFFVHRAEAPLPELLIVEKVVGGHGQVAVAKPLGRGSFLEVFFHALIVIKEAGL